MIDDKNNPLFSSCLATDLWCYLWYRIELVLTHYFSTQIDDFGTRDYKLTEKERIEVKFLNIDFETVKKKTADYYEQAERVLKMFGADVASYKKDKTNNYLVYAGFAVIATAVTGGL